MWCTSEGLYEVESHASLHNEAGQSSSMLRQLFVTANPKLCFAIKQHFLLLTSFASGRGSVADMGVILMMRKLNLGLKREKYKDGEINFVYIDEVQDLPMSQIALFKYVCSNVEEGFVFSGDTAQTIARGIDFRFQDIRLLFYKNFVPESRSKKHDYRKEKVMVMVREKKRRIKLEPLLTQVI
ncbi:hypothetical protein ACLB2K_033499 [Fragaria x ananassa]